MPNDESIKGQSGNVYRKPDSSSEIAESGGSQWLDEHLDTLRQSIFKEASSRAKAKGHDEPEPRDIAQAALLFAPGDPSPPYDRFYSLTKIGITGVTLVSSLLAIAFGLIGMYQTRAGNAQMASGAFDIAKIFAGAIVGSTGATVASKRR